MDTELSISEWARDEVFSADLKHARRAKRAVAMLTAMAASPAGCVLDVFKTSADRQGAYDFLENGAVGADALCASFAEATSARAARSDYAFVAVDGSSLNLTDRALKKDFGSVGTNTAGARGLKVISAYAVSTQGVPLGVCAQVWWARTPCARRQDHKTRELNHKETRHWIEAIESTCVTFQKVAPATRCWFQVDREGDGAHVLSALDQCGHWFTVRSSHDRRVYGRAKRPRYLRKELSKAPIRGQYSMTVSAAPGRQARTARMVVRWVKVTLRMSDPATGKMWPVTLTAVSTREVGTTPRGNKPLHWVLLTNHPVDSLEDARLVIYGYSLRWRVEELHRTWKSGSCNVEQSQLRKKAHVIKWATLMVAVAARIERLKALARTEPELAATCELTPYEIKALVLVRRRTKKRTDSR
jgi:transposase-like protein/DDE family transposase